MTDQQIADLVKRLRGEIASCVASETDDDEDDGLPPGEGVPREPCELCGLYAQCADALEALQARCADAERERDEARAMHAQMCEEVKAMAATVFRKVALEAQVQILTAEWDRERVNIRLRSSELEAQVRTLTEELGSFSERCRNSGCHLAADE